MNAQAAPQTSRYRSRAKVTLLFACCLILCIGAVGLRAVGPTVNGHASGGGFPFTGVILFVCILAIATVLRVVHHAENRLRSDTPVAQAYMRADPSGAAPTSTDGSSRPSGLPGPSALAFGRTYSPTSRSGATIACVAILIASVLIGVPHYVQAQRSAFVQKHGTSANATALRVNNLEHCSGKGGCSWTATIPVTLAPPVDGVSASVIYYPRRSAMSSGEQVRALVDPRHPGYAELPGSPFGTAAGWVIPLLLAVGALGFGALEALGLIHLQGHRREYSARATPAAAVTSQSA